MRVRHALYTHTVFSTSWKPGCTLELPGFVSFRPGLKHLHRSAPQPLICYTSSCQASLTASLRAYRKRKLNIPSWELNAPILPLTRRSPHPNLTANAYTLSAFPGPDNRLTRNITSSARPLGLDSCLLQLYRHMESPPGLLLFLDGIPPTIPKLNIDISRSTTANVNTATLALSLLISIHAFRYLVSHEREQSDEAVDDQLDFLKLCGEARG